jgi:hypothetical protein
MMTIEAKRGDFVCVELQHTAVFQDSSIGRVVTPGTVCGIVWNVTRDGMAKTVRTREGYIRPIEKITGYVCHHIVKATSIDVAKAIEAAQAKDTPGEVREAVRPFLYAAVRTPLRRGTCVFVDGRDTANVWEAFPQGSTSYAFPHYVLVPTMAPHSWIERFVVAWDRVGFVPKGDEGGAMIDTKTLLPGVWIDVKDPTGRVHYGGVFQVVKCGRVNVRAYCDVRWSPTGPVFRQEYRIPLRHVVRIVPAQEVQRLRPDVP